MNDSYDIAVIGSGPGGYVAAIRAAQLGLKVVCVEKSELGGVCLNWGCIPTKAIIKSADLWSEIQRSEQFGLDCKGPDLIFPEIIKRSRQAAERLSKGVEFLFRKNKVKLLKGFARLKRQNVVEVLDSGNNSYDEVYAKNIIIATGSKVSTIPNINIDKKKIITSREALSLQKLPLSIAIVGAGAIGIEFAYIFNSFGVDVSIIEIMPRILPNEEEGISRELARIYKKRSISIYTSSKVKEIKDNGKVLSIGVEENGKERELTAESVLIAVGVQGNVEGIGLEAIGITVNESFIEVDKDYKTSIENIYAIGDVIGNPCLAHVASAEGIYVAEKIAGKSPSPINYRAIPNCVYCQPQTASSGITEKEVKEKGIKVKIGKSFFRGNGKSVATGEIDGFVKVIFNAETDELIGAHIIGSNATEIISELNLAISNKMKFHDLKSSVHAHPTFSETVQEAIASAYKEAIHS